MSDDYLAPAVAAAVAAGDRRGLPTDRPDVLATRSNVLVRLGPVVARVPATTLLTRPDVADWLARDVALASFLAGRGAPVVPPADDPGPHVANGLPVTFWRHVEPLPGYHPSAAEVAGTLAEVHEHLRAYPGDVPAGGPLAETYRMLGLLADDLAGAGPTLRAQVDALAERLPTGRVQVLHGDAHPGNLLGTSAGPRWIDFEDTWKGPLGWDLAVLAGARPDAAAAYPDAPGELAPWTELRELFGICWRFVIARRFPHRRQEAVAALAAHLGRP